MAKRRQQQQQQQQQQKRNRSQPQLDGSDGPFIHSPRPRFPLAVPPIILRLCMAYSLFISQLPLMRLSTWRRLVVVSAFYDFPFPERGDGATNGFEKIR